MVYAQNTTVPIEKTQADISAVLRKYGADGFANGWTADQAMLEFVANDRRVRFLLTLAKPDDNSVAYDGRGHYRSESARTAACDQENRRRWRALLLTIKAKLEAVESKISTFEQEFLAHTVMPDGRTVADHVLPGIERAYNNDPDVKLLAIGSGK